VYINILGIGENVGKTPNGGCAPPLSSRSCGEGYAMLFSVVQRLGATYRGLCIYSSSFFYLQSFHLFQTA
jgi:hypothetical protein